MPKARPACPSAAPDATHPVCSSATPCARANPEIIHRGNVTLSVDRVAKTITMTGKQEFYGAGASQAYADRATQEINDTWSGPTRFEGADYTVVSNISGSTRPDGSPATAGSNQINVVHTTVPAGDRNGDPANQAAYGRSPGHQHDTEDDDGGLTIAHEFGHSMGLPDEYREGARNPDGTRSIVRTGPAGGLMGYIDRGSKPTADNFNALVTGCNLLP